ncbi:MAG: lamin tail domain-containing protein, partial [Saprospiraceae bacterium]|nr:lamin tail domain-containing protein [Saprospiraceae bacterium]
MAFGFLPLFGGNEHPPFMAPCADLFISEYVEGSGNNKAIEIYNPTASTITLTGNYQLKFYFNGSGTASTTINLTGTIAPYDVYVVCDDNSNAGILAVADLISTASFFNGDDAVELFKNSTATVLDVIGQIGFDPGTEWGTGLTSTADNTLRRKSAINMGDVNGADAFDPSIEWDGFAQDNIDNLGMHTSACAVCDITSVTFNNVSACNDNGTSDPSDDFFTADVVVNFVNPPASGDLQIEPGGDAIGTYSIPVGSLVGNSHTFTGVQLKADGTQTVIEVEFSVPANQCVQTQVGPTVSSCSPVCDITSVTFNNVSTCNDNGTSDPSDDYFTADVVVNFVNPPASGDLQIEPGGDAIGTYSIPVGSLIGNSHTFTGVQLKADGTQTLIEVEFTVPPNQCVQTQVGPTVSSCSSAGCDLTDAGLADVHCEDNNETGNNSSDDYIWFQLTPAGVNVGTGYNVTVSSGSVLLNGSIPPNDVPYGITSSFRLQAGSAGAGDVTVTITDVADPNCTISVLVEDPGSCSSPNCFLDGTCPPQPSGTYDCNNPLPAPATTVAEFEALGGDIGGEPCGTVVVTSTTASINNCTTTSVARTYFIFDDADNNGEYDTDETSFTCVLNYTYQPDQTPPTLNGPFPGGISLDCGDPLPTPPTLTATDNCGSASVTYAQTMEPAGCPQEKFLYRTWTPVDACNISGLPYTQTITITDDTAPVFNQPLPQDQTIACGAPIPTPAIVTASDDCDPGNVAPVIWINEIHYDNTGTDVGEFVEVAGTAGLDLTQYAIVLYNGNGGNAYDTDNLVGTIDDEGNGTGAVALFYPANGIQNGTPDGVALIRLPNTVIQFLSYEGAFLATDGPAAGITSQNIPVLELGTEAAGLSIQLTGSGDEYADFTWVGPLDDSPGTLNTNQTVQPQMGVITATMEESTMMGSCTGSLIIKRTYTATDACGNPSVYTQTINVVDNVAPVFAPPLPQNITIACNAPVPPAPTLVAIDACSQAMPQVWINEIHYDNTGADQGEFIEIAGQAGTDLSQYSLVLYNGSTGNMGGTYNTLVLSGLIDNESNGHGAISFGYPQDGIQNGPSDGIALVKGGMVLQFLSYEGVMTAVGGPANGQVSTDIGVAETGADPAGLSLRLTGNGNQYSAFTWNAPAAATPGSINQGQTFTPIQNGIPVTFTETMAPGNCPQNKTITRTWKASDACGNMVQHTQTISVVDNVAPTIVCQNVTVNLDIFGNASVTQAQLIQSLSDNCAAANTITVTPAGPFNFTCAQQGTTQPVTLTATDPCNNSSSCTALVTINPFVRCTPVILIVDPCVCKNNATTLTNGQFGERIKVESLAGQTWTVTAVSGLFSTASVQPPGAPTPIAIGTILQQIPANSGDYYLEGIHVDALGYSVTVQNNLGQSLTIGNQCAYPNPSITSDLSGPFCLFSDPVDLTGTPGDANIVSAVFTVNGVQTTTFNPSQGVGQYEIVYTVDGGLPKAASPNDPGCIQSVKTYVNVVATPSSLVCNDLVIVSVDENCEAEINPDMILEGSYGCYDDYIVEIDKTLPYGNGPWVPGFVNVNDLGKTYQVRVTHLISGNKCWGNIKVEDKLAPVLECTDIDLNCAI